VKRQSAGVALADQIERDIRSARHAPDSVLGFETELQSRHGAGRSVVRQAIRILVQRGIVYTRRGKGGGTMVAKPDPESASRGLSIVLEAQLISMAHISELLRATDSHLFSNCVPRARLSECEQLRSLVRHLHALPAAEFLRVGAHRQVQVALRKVLGDPAASLAQRTCMDCGIDLMPYSVHVVEEGRRGEFWELTLQMAEALVAGDARLMFELHMLQRKMFEANWPQLRASSIAQDKEHARVDDLSSMEKQSGETGAERLTREILRDIRARGWKVGERLGGAEDLMQRFGASPGVLRQAVRMLEEYSAVQMQRGPGGGLRIAAPNETRAIQRAVSYLRTAEMNPQDVLLYLRHLLLEALNHSAGAPDPSHIAQLREVSERAISSRARAIPETDAELFLAIAQLSDNPALQLFVRLLLTLLPQPYPAHGAPAILEDMLQGIAAGDAPKARRAFLQYTNPRSSGR
jgi:DNA-binding FadR family transcriptional regulator